MRDTGIPLYGRDLVLGEDDALPKLTGETVSSTVELASESCTFTRTLQKNCRQPYHKSVFHN